MRPIQTDRSTFIYRSPSPDGPDMPGERIEPGHIRSVWELTETERADVFQGGNIELNILAEPIPPVSLSLTFEGTEWSRRFPVLVAERFLRDDGSWYVRLLTEHGVTLSVSRGYMLERSAKRAQHRLIELLPGLEIWPP